MPLAADCKTQLCKRHAPGVNLIHQRTIAVESSIASPSNKDPATKHSPNKLVSDVHFTQDE